MRKIAIAGAGAVGGLIAWHLVKAGHDPVLVARPASAGVLRRDGLTLVGDTGPGRLTVKVTSQPQDLGPQDLVLAGFKAQDWPQGLAQVLPLMGPHTLLVPLLNGVPWWFFQGFGGKHEGRSVGAVDPDGLLARSFNPAQIVGAVLYVAASREGPARILWNGRNRIVLGAPLAGRGEAAEAVSRLLAGAGLGAETTGDIRNALWLKLLGNAAFNPLSVAAQANMGRLLTHPPLYAILREMVAEAIRAGQALGLACATSPEERLQLPASMHGFKTSMLQDFEAGRGLELGGIVDALAELAGLAGVPVPMIAAIGALAAEASARQTPP